MTKVDEATGEIIEADPDLPTSGTALARTTPQELQVRSAVSGLLRPVAQPAEVLAAQEETRALVTKTLKEDRDYGLVPGTEKKTLLQPGAQRIASAFGTSPRYETLEAEVDHDRVVQWQKKKKRWKGRQFDGYDIQDGESVGFYRFVIRCQLVHRGTGVVVGEGVGTCSTLEDRYVDRPRDLEHTVRRMAEKRALVGAVLSTFALSDSFGDIDEAKEARDDLPPEERLRIARGRYHSVLGEIVPNPQIRELARAAYQEAHPNLPDSSTEWTLEHFETAAEDLERKAERVLQRAVEVAAKRDPIQEPVRKELEGILARDDGSSEERTQLHRWLLEIGVGSWAAMAIERVRAESAAQKRGRRAKAKEEAQESASLPQSTFEPDDDLPF